MAGKPVLLFALNRIYFCFAYKIRFKRKQKKTDQLLNKMLVATKILYCAISKWI